MLKFLTIATNWTCNSCCTTCFLWKFREKNPGKLLSLDDYKNLFQSKSLNKLKLIYFTGGEPTINKNFIAILKLAHQYLPKTTLAYTTNGISPKPIIKQVEELKKSDTFPLVSLSLNGRKKVHDKVKGVKGNFDNIIYLANEFKRRKVKFFLNFTIFPFNVEEIILVYKIAKKLKITISYELCRNDRRFNCEGRKYFFTNIKKRAILSSLKKLLRGDKTILPSYLFLKKYFETEKLYFDCLALDCFVYIDPYGVVFPCDGFLEAMKVGNIKKTPLDVIIKSEKFRYIRQYIKDKKCQPCYFTCDIKVSLTEQRINDKSFDNHSHLK